MDSLAKCLPAVLVDKQAVDASLDPAAIGASIRWLTLFNILHSYSIVQSAKPLLEQVLLNQQRSVDTAMQWILMCVIASVSLFIQREGNKTGPHLKKPSSPQ